MAALLACAALASCSEAPGRPNVVVISLDTVRPDHLSAYGYPRPTTPFLESFAGSGRRFDRAYSSSCWTLPAHASLFTGAPPEIHGADQENRRVADSLPLLAESLGEVGYETAAFSGNVWVGSRTGLLRGFDHAEELAGDHYREHVESLAADETGESPPPEEHYIVRRVRSWLDGRSGRERPFFLFTLLVDAHMPYLPSWEAAREFLPERGDRWEAIHRFFPGARGKKVKIRHYKGEEPLSAEELETLRSMYDGTLRIVDGLARSIVEKVDEVSGRDDTLVFILSDHGENIGDHGHLEHIFNLYDSNLRIVLLARGPGVAPGSVEASPVHITDVHATILRAAGARVPDRGTGGTGGTGRNLLGENLEGRIVLGSLAYPSVSLGTFPDKMRDSGVFAPFERSLKAAVGPRYKLIRGSDGTEEIFDLIADERETRPVPAEAVDPGELEALRSALDRAASWTVPEPIPPLSDVEAEELLRELEAMGYADTGEE